MRTTTVSEEQAESDHYFASLGFTQKELYAAARSGYDDLIDFVASPPFRRIYAEMKRLPPSRRPAFVKEVLLNPQELRARGLTVPDDILIQRSTFGDRRPTLFCAKKFLPDRFHVVIQNVNLTFDNPVTEDLPEGEGAWREPLPVEVQSVTMESGRDLQGLSDSLSVSLVDSKPYPNPVVDSRRGGEQRT